jgi:DNA-binding NarL/FixJ family response regulator
MWDACRDGAAECYGRRVPPLRVVIADDSLLIREGVARVLVDAGIEVVARAGDGEELLRVVDTERPDVVVVDIRMPPTHTDEGVRAAREIRRRFPGVGVLVLSQYAEPEYVVELLQDGASGIGYLLKDRIAEVEDFGAAVRRVAAGGSALDPAVVELIVTRAARSEQPAVAPSDMERVILEHAVAWAREHQTGVAREVGSEFVAVLPDGRHSRHARFHEALAWLEAHGSTAD